MVDIFALAKYQTQKHPILTSFWDYLGFTFFTSLQETSKEQNQNPNLQHNLLYSPFKNAQNDDHHMVELRKNTGMISLLISDQKSNMI
jgi:hypothetical protein